AWTSWLIALSLAPNEAANVLMNTGDYDDGLFWLMSDEQSTLQLFSVLGLAIVNVFYVFVLLKMLVWRTRDNVVERWLDRIMANGPEMARPEAPESYRKRFRLFWTELTGINGKNRKFWNLWLKALDLAMLSVMLHELLEAGTPVSLTYGCAVMTALNSASCALEILGHRHSAFVEILIDCLFDLLSSVLFPIGMLVYCSSHFEFDRAVFLINLELLPVGSFDRRARMYANPMEIALFRVTFDSLRIQTLADLFLRVGMLFSFCYRFKRIVEVLIDIQTQRLQKLEQSQSGLQRQPTMLGCSRLLNGLPVHQRAVFKPTAGLFIAYSIGVTVVTHQAVATSRSVCLPHPECVVFAYRWQESELCPCRALIDGDPAPKTYFEWTHPVDATNSVRTLAAAGTLETLQLINLQLLTWPDELRACHDLNYISLINCGTEELPVWAKDFRKLQYMCVAPPSSPFYPVEYCFTNCLLFDRQIEGKQGSPNLAELPSDMFSQMPELRYLQLGLHQRMTHLPSLDRARSLRSLVLARMYTLLELPPLTQQSRLERVELNALSSLPWLPDLQPVTKLVHFAVFLGANFCCNGFLGVCDLSNAFCKGTSCFEDPRHLATSATLQVFRDFSDGVCQPSTALSQALTPETIQMCEGVRFRQCRFPVPDSDSWIVGMCLNHRMQVLACNPDPDKMAVRRRQIQDHVGVPCDPEVEAWLGCGQETTLVR
ncbi:hypothetical protein BBJ28_00001335, partial [Nothophytophthora sp. Chile5]